MTQPRPRAIVYIDGLNLYKRLLSDYPEHKWLDLISLCEQALPGYHIIKVRYFTSQVKAAKNDPQMPIRQAIYWRALRTFAPRLEIHLGRMQSQVRKYPIVPEELDESGEIRLARVRRVQEKKTDVSLASYMIWEAATADIELVVLMSSDSDFEPTLHLIKNKLNLSFGLILPNSKPSRSLANIGPDVSMILTPELLASSQLPKTLNDAAGQIHRPETWVKKPDPLTE